MSNYYAYPGGKHETHCHPETQPKVHVFFSVWGLGHILMVCMLGHSGFHINIITHGPSICTRNQKHSSMWRNVLCCHIL